MQIIIILASIRANNYTLRKDRRMDGTLSRTSQRVSVLVLACAHLFLASCGFFGQGTKQRKPPPAPAVANVETVKQGLQISWKPVPGADRYTVFWGFAQDQYRGMFNTKDCTLILAGLGKGRIVYLAVSAWNSDGESPCSAEQAIVYDDDPSRAHLYLKKGQEALQSGNYEDAEAYLSAAITLDPLNADAYRGRAAIYDRLSRSDLAREDYQKADEIFKKKLLPKDGPRS